MLSQVSELEQLYNDIHQCKKCERSRDCKIKPDPEKVRRKVIPNALLSRVFLVGQALARDQQRLSGIPYTYPCGRLSRAGMNLNKYLTKVGYCIPHLGNDRHQMVYSSDIIQCWTGSKGSRSGDIKLDAPGIHNCFYWLLREIEIVKPRFIILLGKEAVSVFFQRYLGQKIKRLEEALGQENRCIINASEVYLYALPHPVKRYPNWDLIYTDTFRQVKLRLDSLFSEKSISGSS